MYNIFIFILLVSTCIDTDFGTNVLIANDLNADY